MSTLHSSEALPQGAAKTGAPSTVTAYVTHGFSIQGVSLGMSRGEVERLLGTGENEGDSTVGYGKKWVETNPFDIERRDFRISYDDQDNVISVTGPILSRHDKQVKPLGTPSFEFEEFGPSNNVGVAVRTGGEFDSAVMLDYPAAGVHVEYYTEDRMWFSIFPPYEK